MEVVLPVTLVCVLAVSAAPNATRRRPDPVLDDISTRRRPDPVVDEVATRKRPGLIAEEPIATHRRPDSVADEPILPDEDDELHNFDYYDENRINISEKGMYIGSPCEFTCNSKLVHVFCEPGSGTCQCDPKHPVSLGLARGCSKPKKLGEQCFYEETCRAFDVHSSCVQVNHNAFCACDSGYHSTSHSRPTNRVFCTEDMVLLTADMPTLLGVGSGIFVLAGLLCMVLHLYTRARYHPAHLADARFTPPCHMSLNDTATMSNTRASSRASSRSGGTAGSVAGSVAGTRRGTSLPAGRAGAARAAAILLISRHLRAVADGGAHPHKCAAKDSRRPSLSSVQSSSSSIRSYSARRWEREREQKERRQMSMRLAQLHDKMTAGREIPKHAPTPSPRSPNNSTDGLLPAVCEIRELSSISGPTLQGVDGPCSSSSLY